MKVRNSFPRSAFAAVALAALSISVGCMVAEEPDERELPTIDPALEEEMMSTAEAFSDGEEVPYSSDCVMYGDCAYCESSEWYPILGCVLRCYSWYCYDGGDQGASCYWDCSYYI